MHTTRQIAAAQAASAASASPICPPVRCSSSSQLHRHAVARQQQLRSASPQQKQQLQHTSSGRRTLQLARAEPAGSSANGSSSSSSSLTGDSDLGFLLKLLAFSFAGAAVIKYGSLLISLPFEPSAAVALLLVLGTPSAYAVYLLAFKQGGGSQQQ